MIFMTREQIQKYDEVSIVDYGIDGAVLMENAGAGAARIILTDLEGVKGSVAIVAGPGNNGGDGFVVARHLLNAGRRVRVFFVGQRDRLQGDAKKNFEIIVKMGVSVTDMPRDGDAEALSETLRGRALVVDALFGTGLDREITGLYRRAIELINASGVPVTALDMPSGVDANTGRPHGVCIRAKKTITFACLKRGIAVYPGAEMAGEVRVVDIGAPRDIVGKVGYDGEIMEEDTIRRWVGPRAGDTHKGTFGHVLVLAGSPGKTGAALMASLGALRCGAGLVTIAAQQAVAREIETAKPLEVMVETFDPSSPESAARLLEGRDAVAFGPGCGVGAAMEKVLEAVLAGCRVPLVIDADGLTMLSGHRLARLDAATCPVILTPHPGEMARLAGSTKEEVQTFRIPVSRELAGRTKAHLVLKGARTVIADPEGRIFVNPTGNPGMASGGMGDVLTGMIASFCGQGLTPLEAACLSVFVHGRAGDLAKEARGERGLIASDVVDFIPAVLKDFEIMP
jgi:hydroxyethylthiazole kinase-like uncharacterized protein yjeF